jgi:hypothetical protein
MSNPETAAPTRNPLLGFADRWKLENAELRLIAYGEVINDA